MRRPAIPIGRKWLLPLALVALIGGAWWWQRPPPDPVLGGQRLSEYFEDHGSRDEPPVHKDLERFGPEGVTWLIHKLEYGGRAHDPLLPDRGQPFDRAPKWLRKWVPEGLGGLRGAIDWDERELAARILEAFGPEAAPAIPALARAMEDENSALPISSAAALLAIGPAAWPAIDNIVERGSVRARSELVGNLSFSLGKLRPRWGAEPAHWVEVLIKALHDSDIDVRISAILTIASLHASRPEVSAVTSTIPELIPFLFDTEGRVRSMALHTLAELETDAAPVRTRVLGFLDSEDPLVRSRAIEALFSLDRVKQESPPRLRMVTLHDPDSGCRKAAAGALQAWGVAVDDVSAVEK